MPGLRSPIHQAELDKDTENRKIYSGSVNGSLPEDKQAEEQALSAAWEKMLASRREEAFDELFPPGCALTQPQVFMLYRGICQTAPLPAIPSIAPRIRAWRRSSCPSTSAASCV